MLLLQGDTTAPIRTATEAVSAAGGEKLTILEVFWKGGIVLIPIMILFFVTIYIIVERYLAIRRSMAVDRSQVMTLHSSLKKGDMETALNICKGSSVSKCC